MTLGFIQYLLMISPEKVNLDKTKFKKIINFKFKFSYIYIILYAIFFICTKSYEECDTDWSRLKDTTHTIFRILFKKLPAKLFKISASCYREVAGMWYNVGQKKNLTSYFWT